MYAHGKSNPLWYDTYMIRTLRGTVGALAPSSLVIDVNGVGYFVRTLPDFAPLLEETVMVHTYLAVRENALDLYGFAHESQLNMFELLLTIPKVGPKSAMQFLSQARVPVLRHAIVTEDPQYLSRLSEISTKNAEKIVLALKGKLDDTAYENEETAPDAIPDIRAEVAEALIALGYTPKDARDVARELPNGLTDINAALRVALASLGMTKK